MAVSTPHNVVHAELFSHRLVPEVIGEAKAQQPRRCAVFNGRDGGRERIPPNRARFSGKSLRFDKKACRKVTCIPMTSVGHSGFLQGGNIWLTHILFDPSPTAVRPRPAPGKYLSVSPEVLKSSRGRQTSSPGPLSLPHHR